MTTRDFFPGGWYWKNESGSDKNQGDVILINNVVAVLENDIANNGTGLVYVTQNLPLAKKDNVSFDCGDKAYWDSTNVELTDIAEGNSYAGRISIFSATADTTAYIDLNRFS